MAKKKYSSGAATTTGETANAQSYQLCFPDDSEKMLRADAKHNREQILQAARKAFSEKGLSVQVTEIARMAGIGIGTIYRHFPTKEALFDAVSISYKQKLTEEAKSLISHTDPGKAFFDFLTGIMEDGFTNRAARDAFRIGTFRARTEISGALLDLESACDDLLTRAQQATVVREDINIMDLFALMSGLLMIVDKLEDVSDTSRFHHLLSIVFDGLRYKPHG